MVFSKEPKPEDTNANWQVVMRVSDKIRDVLKKNKDRIYIEVTSHRIVDRFYIKRCNKCLKFGHYAKDCHDDPCCGYCCGKHISTECTEKEGEDEYKCNNCVKSKKGETNHSALWYKCPTYLEAKESFKKSIPYYSKN